MRKFALVGALVAAAMVVMAIAATDSAPVIAAAFDSFRFDDVALYFAEGIVVTPAIKSLREKQEKLLADARKKLDEIKDDTTPERAKEIETEYDAMMAEYDTIEARVQKEVALEERKRTLKQRADELEEIDTTRRPGGQERAAAGAGGGNSEQEAEAAQKAYRAAFVSYIRHGSEGITAEERRIIAARRDEVRKLIGEAEARAQGVATAGAGGALVPQGFMAELIKSLALWGPMNDDAIVRAIETASGNDLPWPTVNDTTNEGALINENTQVSEQDVTFSSVTLQAFKYTSRIVLVSQELLQDSAIDVEATIRDLMAERIGRIYNRHFTVGTGSSQPNGIVTGSTLGKTAASSVAITFDEMIDLQHSVDPAYRADPSTRWMFHDLTFRDIRKLKDGDNNYIWQPANLQTGAPANLLGFPYSVNNAMEAVESGSPTGGAVRAVIFGAFKRYVVRRVRSFAVRRLNERYADYDQVGFIGFTRADGDLMDTAAVKHLAMA